MAVVLVLTFMPALLFLRYIVPGLGGTLFCFTLLGLFYLYLVFSIDFGDRYFT